MPASAEARPSGLIHPSAGSGAQDQAGALDGLYGGPQGDAVKDSPFNCGYTELRSLRPV